jgi:hypothetical protein
VIKDILTALDYWADLEKCLAIFKPIDKWIKFFQSDQAEVSIVYKAFFELPGVFEQLPISDKENKYFISCPRKGLTSCMVTLMELVIY